MKVDLVIKDFPADTEQAELADHLVALGLAVVACRIVDDGRTNRAIALIERSTNPSSTAALVNGTSFRGHTLRATLGNARGSGRRTQHGGAIALLVLLSDLVARLAFAS